jgi:plastocyanin
VRRLLPTALLSAALLGACGGGDGKGRSLTLRSGQPLHVAAHEYRFDPGDVTVTGAHGAANLRLVLDNRGALAHNLRVHEGERDLGGTSTFHGGPPRPATVRLTPGVYRMVCTVGDHEQLGMVGTLRVRG